MAKKPSKKPAKATKTAKKMAKKAEKQKKKPAKSQTSARKQLKKPLKAVKQTKAIKILGGSTKRAAEPAKARKEEVEKTEARRTKIEEQAAKPETKPPEKETREEKHEAAEGKSGDGGGSDMPSAASHYPLRDISHEMEESYLDYAMSVIVSRALPDVRDGLKPVHRRILYAMHELGLSPGAKYRKSAAVVGDVLGKYHPHGDSSVYEAMVRMAQDFAMRYMLVDGQGNFGSVDGDSAAAMRYCVTGDTIVPTNHGLQPIENIPENDSEEIDIKILSKGRVINRATKWFDSGSHPTIRIETARGYAIQGTYNHPILTLTKNLLTKEPEFRWKLLEEIVEGDVAVIDRNADILWPAEKLSLKSFWPQHKAPRAQKILPQELDENLAFILGALLAEGTVHENEIEFCNGDPRFIQEFQNRWQRVFPDCRLHHFKKKPSSFGKKPYETLEIHSRHVVEFLRNLGLIPVKSDRKVLPKTIFLSTRSVIASFLQAYFEGDGTITFGGKMTELSAISKSNVLLRQLQIVLLRFGIAATQRFDRYRNISKLYIRGLQNYSRFKDNIGFFSERKKEKLSSGISRLHKDFSQTDYIPFLREYIQSSRASDFPSREFIRKHNFDRYPALAKNYERVVSAVRPTLQADIQLILQRLLENHYLFDPIVKIQYGGVQKVYSLKVDSACHSFVANGFINHNTEARMTKVAEEMLADIEKDTVEFRDNYDATRKEPVVLPSKVPQLLLNGVSGIAVGMATSIPPHNLTEVCDAVTNLADHPDATIEDLLEIIKGPDFPTGGIMYGREDIKAMYVNGRGGVVVRAKAEIEEVKGGKFRIVVTEIPYQVNKSQLVSKIAELVQEKRVIGISDVRDESNRHGISVVIELKKDAYPKKILNQLFKYTQLQTTFNMNMIALVEGVQPRLLNLKQVLEYFIEHRKITITRRTQFELNVAKARAHILEGLKKALDNIDAVIKTIKESETKEVAHDALMKKFKLTDIQANAILEMRLQTLAGLERKKIDDELKEKRELMAHLEGILKDPKKVVKIMKDELAELKEKYGDERRTRIMVHAVGEISAKDTVPNEPMVVTLTRANYVKRVPPSVFRTQNRGGKGVIGMTTKEEDEIKLICHTKNHENLLFFTNKGRVFTLPVYEVPQASRISKGQAIVNLLQLQEGEGVTAMLNVSEKFTGEYLIMCTKSGTIKKTPVADFQNVRRSGLIAIKLRPEDSLNWVKEVKKGQEVFIATAKGKGIRFDEKDVRSMGRPSMGVRGISLKNKDEVVEMDVIPDSDAQVLVVMENGLGKATKIRDYRKQRRGGSGVKNAKVTAKTGEVVAAKIFYEKSDADLICVSKDGQVIRMHLQNIPSQGRATQGVYIMRLNEGDLVASVSLIIQSEEDKIEAARGPKPLVKPSEKVSKEKQTALA